MKTKRPTGPSSPRTKGPPWVPPLLRWYAEHRRPMPWRSNPTPYRVWISEIMLQQTRVEAAIPYFGRFLRRFPSAAALARADLQDVLRAWEGLGYYARARNLRRAAQAIVAGRGGRLPETAEELLELPGIGSYTAAAIASICFEQPVPVVDGNVLRVFTRFWCMAEDVHQAGTKTLIARRLDGAIRCARPSIFNQAIMEVGALVCKPRTPDCPACPLRKQCCAHISGRIHEFPRKSRVPEPPHRLMAAAVIWKGSRVLLCRRREDRMLGGLWEFPWGAVEPDELPECAAARVAREETGLTVTTGAPCATVRHTYSHFSMTLTAFRCAAGRNRARPARAAETLWVHPRQLPDYPLSKAQRRLAHAVTLGAADKNARLSHASAAAILTA